MATFDTDAMIEIEPWEFVSSCSSSEIKELIEELVDEGYLPESVLNVSNTEKSITDLEWDDACSKLIGRKHLLSVQDEQMILSIAKKII